MESFATHLQSGSVGRFLIRTVSLYLPSYYLLSAIDTILTKATTIKNQGNFYTSISSQKTRLSKTQ